MQNSPPADFGVYGIFARLTSPGLEPSEPFLLAFRYGVAAEDFSAAAEAINLAAGLPGDYNVDGTVDAADYTVWRDTLGSVTLLAADGSGNHAIDQDDYAVWRDNFGRSEGGFAAAAIRPVQSTTVPEPATMRLLVWTILASAATATARTIAPARSRRKPSRSSK
jgi:hypothetical protein